MTKLGGTYRLGDREVHRMGYGAMQLAGPHVFGPPRDRDAASAVLRAAVALMPPRWPNWIGWPSSRRTLQR